MPFIEYYLLKDNIKIRVCKTMIFNTFGIGVKMMRKLIPKTRTDTEVEYGNNKDDNFETFTANTKNRNTERKSLLNMFVDLFQRWNYCQENTSKLYLEPVWLTKKALYDIYCEDFCLTNQITPMHKPVFDSVLENKNIFLYILKQDTCNICTMEIQLNIHWKSLV